MVHRNYPIVASCFHFYKPPTKIKFKNVFFGGKEIASQTAMKYGIEDFFFPFPLEYDAELPPFPEGYKVKQEAMITVSITQAPT